MNVDARVGASRRFEHSNQRMGIGVRVVIMGLFHSSLFLLLLSPFLFSLFSPSTFLSHPFFSFFLLSHPTPLFFSIVSSLSFTPAWVDDRKREKRGRVWLLGVFSSHDMGFCLGLSLHCFAALPYLVQTQVNQSSYLMNVCVFCFCDVME